MGMTDHRNVLRFDVSEAADVALPTRPQGRPGARLLIVAAGAGVTAGATLYRV